MRRNRPHKDGYREEEKAFDERVLQVDRVTRVVKGGRRMRFRALVVVGDRKGKIGFGVAKANEVAGAVRKASTQAQKHLIQVPVINGTIPHEIRASFSGADILLKPASEGTSIVAGGIIRTIAELSGIENLLSKMLGSSNKMNNVQAMFKALTSFKDVEIYQSKKPAAKSVAIEEKVEATIEKTDNSK